VDWF